MESAFLKELVILSSFNFEFKVSFSSNANALHFLKIHFSAEEVSMEKNTSSFPGLSEILHFCFN